MRKDGIAAVINKPVRAMSLLKLIDGGWRKWVFFVFEFGVFFVLVFSVLESIDAGVKVFRFGQLQLMVMQQSNNVYTRALVICWSLAPAMAVSLGIHLSSSCVYRLRIHCRGGVMNEQTLSNAAKLYSSVYQGIALAGTAKSTFFNIRVGRTPSIGDAYGTVISQQAAAVGKSVIVSQFLSQFSIRDKPRGYTFCMCSDCSVAKVDDSQWMSVPFKSNGLLAPQCKSASCGKETAANVAEAAMSTIRQALLTW